MNDKDDFPPQPSRQHRGPWYAVSGSASDGHVIPDRPVADREPLSHPYVACPEGGCELPANHAQRGRDFLLDIGIYYGETYIDDPITPRKCWLMSDGAGSSVPIEGGVLELVEALDAARAQPAVPVAGAVHINDGSAERDAMAWSKGHTAGFDEGAAGLRQAISVLENYGDHHEWCTDKTGGDHCPCRFRDEITALDAARAQPAVPVAGAEEGR